MSTEQITSEQKILDAAKRVFENYGYTGARMQQIADEAGISKASLHYYFRSKENLFDRIFEETISAFLPITMTWDDESTEWEEKMRSFIRQFFEFLKTNSMLFILGEINRNPDLLLSRKKDNKPKTNKFIAYFTRLQEKKVVKEVDPKLVYIFLHSLCSYPLINQEIFKMITRTSDKEYETFLKDYPDHVADFLISIYKKQKIK